jgi:acyl-coenzyme A thioesterase PaaI-like protein
MTEPTEPFASGRNPLIDPDIDGEVSPRRAGLHRLAAGMRGILHRLARTTAPIDMVEQAASELEAMAERFASYPGSSVYEGYAEAANAGEPFASLDFSPVQGRANPLAPPLVLRIEPGGGELGDTVVATGTFGAAYEGPPGCVHGGFVAAAFDEVLGATQSMSGSPGMTAHLEVDYRSPTPLHTELRFAGVIERIDGRKIHTRATLHAGDRPCAESYGLFISMDPEKFATLMAEREERQSKLA